MTRRLMIASPSSSCLKPLFRPLIQSSRVKKKVSSWFIINTITLFDLFFPFGGAGIKKTTTK
ncbi:hypothetical protein HOP62_10365 [Halomonas sp. MCCC 1A17488]|nr:MULTISPECIES: hypothetical protein [unclassified Halomonas]MCE8016471.1 hypothetical protein [Halomonas sp. MCCC 1A17488]MCG3239804.1 hypothetical protein [Halomonas sp. MCCC 1A17488]QPP50295.1 hypothetical protein I4484_04010 [Halomonas sp. SS10-MC5]